MLSEKLERAKKVYETLCTMFDTDECSYKKNEEDFSVKLGIQGDDFPIEITIRVDPDSQLILLLSHLPFVISEDKRLDVAIATSIVNNRLADGSFDFDITDGYMFFRMTSSFIESEIGSEVFAYMLAASCHLVDEYNDKFLMLGKGMMSIEDFIEKE